MTYKIFKSDNTTAEVDHARFKELRTRGLLTKVQGGWRLAEGFEGEV